MLTLSLIFLAAIFNAVMDTITYHFDNSIFSKVVQLKWYFDPRISWLNKYKNRDPKQGPAFPFSTSILCVITDLWHLAKNIMLVLLYIAITCYTPIFNTWIDIILYYTVFGTTFEVFWSSLFRVKK